MSPSAAADIDEYGQTPLHKAADYNSLDVIKFLFESGAPLTTADNNGKTPLHVAVRSNSVEVVQLFLANGASVSATDNFGGHLYTILVSFAMGKNPPRIKLGDFFISRMQRAGNN